MIFIEHAICPIPIFSTKIFLSWFPSLAQSFRTRYEDIKAIIELPKVQVMSVNYREQKNCILHVQ
jgi:hypothetical protein